MRRRTFLQAGLAAAWAAPLRAALRSGSFDEATAIMERAVASGQVSAASLYLRRGTTELARPFGAAKSVDSMFLLASISKPMAIAAVMTLYDQGKFQLDDPVTKHIPEFTGDGREKMTVRHLMTHVCGLPDQLPENQELRRRHAKLSEFVAGAIRTPLLFEPGTRYSYSSMGILLACEIAQRITDTRIHDLMDQAVFRPLGMQHSVLGLGRFPLADMMRGQIEHAAPESGSGDPTAKDWDWNSPYWRKFGAPWGGVHTTATDVGRFFQAFLHPAGKLLKPETARLVIQNHNPAGLTPRGLGFAVGVRSGSPGCSERTFGHTGSTGTLAWADPATDTICVVLTTLPGRAVDPHPRTLVSECVARAAD